MAALVDTNVLVYRHDPRFPEKQRKAASYLRWGIEYSGAVCHVGRLRGVPRTDRGVGSFSAHVSLRERSAL